MALSKNSSFFTKLTTFLFANLIAGYVFANSTDRSLLAQAKDLPKEFEQYFFDVPLAVRIEVDQKLLGEALVVLSRDDKVTLMEFTDTNDSSFNSTDREKWAAVLKKGVSVGVCSSQCNTEMLALDYSLENSMVSILTLNAERDFKTKQYHDQPESGSRGLILHNQLNLSGGQDEKIGGRLRLEASGSIGNWSQVVNMHLVRSGYSDTPTYHSINELYTQREMEGIFARLGYFTPNSEGLTRPPRQFGSSPDTALGIMVGSSDSLAISNPLPSIYPIYVTANRQASVEIFRDGALINSQAVSAGLQSIDTRQLPGGIYQVEIRLIEDGKITTTTQELVYKPNNWRNFDSRWRYNMFAGRETQLLSNWDQQSDAEMTAGASFNYLAHPRAILGLSARQVRGQWQSGTSLDWMMADNVSMYANIYQTQDHGTGIDLQSLYNYKSGSIMLSHNRSWLDTTNSYDRLPDGTRLKQRRVYSGESSNSSIGVNHRLSSKSSMNARISHSDGNTEGIGLDIGWSQRSLLFANDASWRISLFDRPASFSSGVSRNRGIDLSLNIALGADGENITGTVGSRTARDGARDHNASISWRKQIQDHLLQNVSVTALTDTYGIGLASQAYFDSKMVAGDGYIQRSSYNGNLTGGFNLESTFVVGEEKMMLTSQRETRGAGMIVDVESDIDDIVLRADDLSGNSTKLLPGRNFIPIIAYRNSSIGFDLEGNHAPAASIDPPRTNYHMNKGGIDFRKVRVMKVLTVFGRLLDSQGKPLKGHHVINHASRGITEVDGFFSMQMSAGEPTLEVRKDNQLLCRFRLDAAQHRKENDVLMAGDMRCTPESLAEAGFKAQEVGRNES
ncbi:TcfC E-set like domain-containing protein [Pseudomonas sp. CCNWLW23]|uniref:TcfC E-set like domain-containing protein n=1 Tax=Pseudomonas sp. CCNWLW23 TaxID=3126385 RepID=UPI003012E1CF